MNFANFLRKLFKNICERLLQIIWPFSANIRLDKNFARCLEDVFRLCVQKTSSRRLQDDLIKTNIFPLVTRLHKTSSRRLDQDEYIRLSHRSSIRLQYVFKTSSKRLVSASSRYLQDVLKMYHQVKLFLLTRLQDIFETYSMRFWSVQRRQLPTERFALGTLLRNLWSGYKVSKSDLFEYTETFKTVFLKHFMKWLLLQTRILLLKSGIRKDVAVSINKESMNNGSSKMYFSGFSFSLYYSF